MEMESERRERRKGRSEGASLGVRVHPVGKWRGKN